MRLVWSGAARPLLTRRAFVARGAIPGHSGSVNWILLSFSLTAVPLHLQRRAGESVDDTAAYKSGTAGIPSRRSAELRYHLLRFHSFRRDPRRGQLTH
jgi:hypothetical protein